LCVLPPSPCTTLSVVSSLAFVLMLRLHPRCPLFPYTTLFRSHRPICEKSRRCRRQWIRLRSLLSKQFPNPARWRRSEGRQWRIRDRKSTRLNSSHVKSSYAVFCLKKKSSTIYQECSINLGRGV